MKRAGLRYLRVRKEIIMPISSVFSLSAFVALTPKYISYIFAKASWQTTKILDDIGMIISLPALSVGTPTPAGADSLTVAENELIPLLQ